MNPFTCIKPELFQIVAYQTNYRKLLFVFGDSRVLGHLLDHFWYLELINLHAHGFDLKVRMSRLGSICFLPRFDKLSGSKISGCEVNSSSMEFCMYFGMCPGPRVPVNRLSSNCACILIRHSQNI